MSTKTVIVTGASTGIGKSIARLFLSKGYNVVMNSATQANLEKTVKEFGSPATIKMVAGDVREKTTANEIVATAIKHFGKVDVLVNNAGIFAPKPFLEVEEEDLNNFFEVNLKGTYFTTQAAIREMLPVGGGAIINIGTVLVDHAIAGLPASAPVVSKAAVHALTRQLAAEFGKQNIRINTVAPGIIRSPLQEKIGVSNVDELAPLHLLNRIGEPQDIAELVFTLANNSFITGAIFNVDGGHVAGHSFR